MTTSTHKTQIEKQDKTIRITRDFKAPVDKVWKAFTEKEILDKWWGPSPWRAETKTMDFREGGHWIYAMVGPENEKHWARMNYISIDPQKSYDLEDGFSDENGVMNKELPVSKGKSTFTSTADGTRVEMSIVYPTEADVQKIVEMGFEEGISICLEQLDQLLNQNKV